MNLIPVMDLMAGQVVHARRGERDSYRPVHSTLCPSAAPEAILQAFIEHFSCATVYIADLDAIRFGRPQLTLLKALKVNFPTIRFWVDAGIFDLGTFARWHAAELGTLVIGSESLSETNWLATLARDSWILSLDFKGTAFLGPPDALSQSEIWPQKVLAMNLAQVGNEAGPDYDLLASLRRKSPELELYAAGGVRDESDLRALEQRGYAGALVATALHNGSIKSKINRKL